MATQGKSVEPVDITDRRLLRIEDVADRLAVSRSMAWKLVTYGQLPAVRIGRAVRVRPVDLEAYVANAVRAG
jgi:excisionase family DNA binding protein